METVKTPAQLRAAQKDTLNTIKPSFAKGSITFKRSLMYRRKPAPASHIWYLIQFKEADVLYYKGAYALDLAFERKLLSENKLNDFLLAQLAKEMTA